MFKYEVLELLSVFSLQGRKTEQVIGYIYSRVHLSLISAYIYNV
jgi:hypothetical protein